MTLDGKQNPERDDQDGVLIIHRLHWHSGGQDEISVQAAEYPRDPATPMATAS
jgi:hypothetical protein